MLVFGAALLAYLPAIRGEVLWNDRDYLTAPALQPIKGLFKIWFVIGSTQQYYPLLHSAFWLEHRLWGDAMIGYHLANIGFHASAACLFAMVLRKLWGPRVANGAEWLAALIFVLHPVFVESVAWITEQKNTLSAVFYFASALAYLSFDENRSVRTYGAAFALYVLALLSKTTTVTLPATLLVVLWWRRGRLQWRRDFRPLAPWLLAGAALGLAVSWVERKYIGAEGASFALSFGQRVLVAGRAVWFYAAKDIWPSHLVFFYPKWRPDLAAPWQWLFPVGLAVLAITLWSFRRRARAPLAVLLCFAGVLFPLLGFFNFYGSLYSFVADHWQYLALPVVIAAAVGGVAFLLQRFSPVKRRAIAALGIALPAPLGLLTWHQCSIYRNDDVLYRATLTGNPGCWMAYNNLGEELMEAGQCAEAAVDFQRSVQLEPGYFESHYNFGNALAQIGRWPEAVAEYREALRIRPGNSSIHDNLAIVLSRMGREEEALAEYETALGLDPGNEQAHNNLGNQLARMGRLAEAVDQYEQALKIDPGYPDAHDGLANAWARMGRLSDALDQYRKAVALKPDFAEAQNNLGNALVRMGRPNEAIEHYQAALRLQPSDAEAHLNFGIALAEIPGRLPEAIDQVETALRLKPDDPKTREVLLRLQAMH